MLSWGVGVPNTIVSEDDHHPMIQLLMTVPRILLLFHWNLMSLLRHIPIDLMRSPCWLPETSNRCPQPIYTGSPTSLDTDLEPSASVSLSTRHSDNGSTGIRRSTRTARGQRPSRFEHYTAE